MKYLWLLLVLLAYLVQLFQKKMATTSRQVLPTNVRPVHYDLTLRPDLTTFKFDGRVIVE
jgi:hypothetical protein